MDIEEKRAWLWRYRHEKSKLKRLRSELADLEDIATCITPNLNGMPSGGQVGDKVGRSAGAIADKQEELNAQYLQCDHVRDEIKRAIKTLPTERDKAILTCKFIEGLSDARVAERLDLDERWTRRTIKNCIEKISIDP